MSVSKERASKIAKYCKKHGIEACAEKFGLSYDSVSRYARKANRKCDPDDRPAHLPKVLVFDLETSPILARVWSIWQQNVGLNQIKEDWFLLSYAAKWLGVDGVMYQDLRGVIDDTTKGARDASLLQGMWQLLDEADVVITQNGIKFDSKKINARFVMNGYQPPSHYKHIDTLRIAKYNFGFTSNKLEYMTDKLCTKYKKQVQREFNGFELWKECLADNLKAWKCMEKYNKYDVLSLEELYYILAAWDRKHPNFALMVGSETPICRCGSTTFRRNGYAYTQVSKFQRYKCTECGAETRGRTNVLDKDVRKALHMNISQ